MSKLASSTTRRRVLALVTSVVASAALALASAQSLPELAFEPPLTESMLRPDLAESVRAASVWLFEEDDEAIAVWVWRVPGDPAPFGLFDHLPWADAGAAVERDLGEAMLATVDVFGELFGADDATWSARASALAERLAGVDQTQVLYTHILDDGSAFYGVQITDSFVDLTSLELLEGTWVQVTRLRAE